MKLVVVITMLMPSISWAKSKRFIVHYKTQKSVQSQSEGSSSSVREIVYADSSDQAVSQFPLGSQNIVSIEEDLVLKHFAQPGDFGGIEDDLYYRQWHYFDSLGGIELPDAWDVTTGSSDIVVAVVDTGILNHPELSGRILPGADLISDSDISNDGDERDNDPTDAGDWVGSNDYCFTGSSTASSWHGTHVAGTIAANSANELGVAGIDWKAKILPVRVLGKCGGYMSDIADGIRWAAGGSVSGVSDNENPAQVINLSLGGQGSCSPTIQSAINFARNQGAVVVVAAGNSSAHMDFTPYVPASCSGVITVGAGNIYAEKSYYSNYGSDVDIMAPGGDSSGSILSLGNNGTTTAQAFSFKGMMGTSMAAPHIAGVASLIFGQNPNLNADQVEEIIKDTAKYFSCTLSQGCGAGLVDTYAAISEALVTVGEDSISGSDNLSSGESGQGSDDRIVTYNEDGGGGLCGTVAFVGRDGSGPKGGLGAQILSLFMGLSLMAAWIFVSGFFKKEEAPVFHTL